MTGMGVGCKQSRNRSKEAGLTIRTEAGGRVIYSDLPGGNLTFRESAEGSLTFRESAEGSLTFKRRGRRQADLQGRDRRWLTYGTGQGHGVA